MPPRVSALIALGLLGVLGGAGAFIKHRLDNPPQLALARPTSMESNPPLEIPAMEAMGQLTLGSIDQFQGVIQRPLFSSTRRPPPPPAPEVPEPMPVLPPEPVDEREYILIGVMVTPNANAAVLRDDQGSVSRVQEGHSLDDWQVARILDDHVVLRQGNRVKEVPLLRNQAAMAADSQTAAPKGPQVPSPSVDQQQDPREIRRRMLEEHRSLRQQMEGRGQGQSEARSSALKQ